MVAPPAARPILVQRADRRAARTPYPEVVLVDGEPMTARDISASGVSIVVMPSLAPGDIVRLTLAGGAAAGKGSTTARVSRIEAGAEGLIVGLEFID